MASDWSILIYANGNNELAPEIWNSVYSLDDVQLENGIRVCAQIGSGDDEIVHLMRRSHPSSSDRWTGVRRFSLTDSGLEGLADLGLANMADPMQLYDFLQWAMSCHPAEHYMLIISGHGYQFVGGLTDYSQERPYIMGFPGMSHAITLACSDLAQTIDILALDICHSAFIEIIYEFGHCKTTPIHTILTHAHDAPIEGLPYPQLARLVDKHAKLGPTNLLEHVVENVSLDLAACRIDSSRLESIKRTCNNLAAHWLSLHDKHQEIRVDRSLLNPLVTNPWHPKAHRLHTEVRSMAAHHTQKDTTLSAVHIATGLPDNPETRLFYRKLAFNRHNHWQHLLAQGDRAWMKDNSSNVNAPIELSARALYLNVAAMNPGLNDEQINSIVTELICFKGWDSFPQICQSVGRLTKNNP